MSRRINQNEHIMANILMSPAQCRMARAALELGVLDLAKLADMSTNTIVRLERGEKLRPSTVDQIKRVFEEAGVEFIPESSSGGVGVRLKRTSSTE